MALAITDLIEPDGRLQESLFPAGDIVAKVTAWLAKAGQKVAAAGIEASFVDGATEAYVYYLAYSHVADRLAGQPNKVAIDSAADVEKTVEKDRIAYFKGLAQNYLEEFNSYVGLPDKPSLPTSTWVQNQAIF